MVDQLFEIIRVGVLAIATILIIILALGVLIVVQWISNIFAPKKTVGEEQDEETSEFSTVTHEVDEETTEVPVPEPEVAVEEVEKPQESRNSRKLRPIYDKYPRIYRLEILYWRGVSKPWWWNNYARDLIEYAEEYFPIQKINYFATYNSNSKSQDYANSSYKKRIQFLRTKKVSKHPLVSINYDQELFMINSNAALEEMKDRIDAEWYRHYEFKKTYRDSATEY
ncbi:hypothetical protein KBD71_02005 [Candidatus Woesebacteria bacterium]|nr:hypothetical protein [Candidatus Woesebacteria bacterium]